MNSATPPSAAPQPQSLLMLRLAVLMFLLFTIGFNLFLALKGYSHYRAQHLGPALGYAKTGIDLLNPVIVGFNAGDTPTVLELPLWQAMTGLLMKCFGSWPGWGNVAALLAGAAGLWPLYRLARAHASERVAWWTLLFYSAQPLVFFYNGHGSTDGSCLTLALYFLYFADLLIRTGAKKWFLPAAIFGTLAALTKAPFFFCAGIASLVLLLIYARRSLQTWLLLAGVGAVAVVAFLAWTHHTNALAAKAEFPLVDLRTSGGSDDQFMRDWYFGDWQFRLNPKNWAKGGWRFMNANLGSFALVALLGWGLVASKHRLGQALFVGGLVTTFTFTHLVLHHSHYYLMFSPAVALLCGWGLGALERVLPVPPGRNGSPLYVMIMVSGALLLSTIQGLVGMKISLITDPYPQRAAALLKEQTSPEEKLLIQGGGWGGEFLILSDRKGLSIWDTKFLEQPENLRRIQELGYTKLVMFSESPLLLALQQVNPGQSTQRRDTYDAHLTEVARPWKTLFQTEDLLIKEIPKAPAAAN